MTGSSRVAIETGRNGKKVFGSALDWPGWSRSGKTGEDALRVLADYADRYRVVASIAGLRGVTAAATHLEVVEHLEGTGATDFGVPERVAECEYEPMSEAECDRQVRLLRACWSCFADVASRVSAELRKGPRGGGRDRNEIIDHVVQADRGYGRQIGVRTPPFDTFDAGAVEAHHEAIYAAIPLLRNGEPGRPNGWPLRYFIRRAAWHVMDHAWEMEDKDLTGEGGVMADTLRVVLEIGPKGKKVVATAWDWPGLERHGRTEDDALEKLEAYLPRYRSVTTHAGLTGEFERQSRIEVVERYAGNSSTDFWGISWVSCYLDQQPIARDAWERHLALLRACWAKFDEIAARVSPELAKGPRGGGRDRDEIVNHVFGNERTQFSRRVGVEMPPGVMLTPGRLGAHRDAFVDGLREYHEEGRKVGRTWTLSYLLRHTAYHVMDHAWELQDRDLTGKVSS